jgi:Protein of unknown function (DUF4007)
MIGQLSLGVEEESKKLIIAFARHETFWPRFGWLKKGFDRASYDPKVFLSDDAPVRLGVGKNMVTSIRYWCSAFKVLKNDCPTEFGEQLLGENGWDPYTEDPASLWLLHWHLLNSPCQATSWDFVFNQLLVSEFSQTELMNQLLDYRDKVAGHIAESSIQKDVSCILRMYTRQLHRSTKSGAAEDSLDCPFSELGLISTAGDDRHYTFRVGEKRNLPAHVTVYACLQYALKISRTAQTIPLSKLLYDVGSPGMIFKLNESSLCGAIEKIERDFDNKVQITDMAGRLQFAFNSEPGLLSQEILNSYYAAR